MSLTGCIDLIRLVGRDTRSYSVTRIDRCRSRRCDRRWARCAIRARSRRSGCFRCFAFPFYSRNILLCRLRLCSCRSFRSRLHHPRICSSGHGDDLRCRRRISVLMISVDTICTWCFESTSSGLPYGSGRNGSRTLAWMSCTVSSAGCRTIGIDHTLRLT